MNITQTPSDIANFLYYCTDDDYAEVFALYTHMCFNSCPSASDDANEITLRPEDMRIKTDVITTHIKRILDEIIYSDEIDESAWWKGE